MRRMSVKYSMEGEAIMAELVVNEG
jgi:hypothetical protein